MVKNSMIHISRNERRPTVLSCEPGKIRLNLGRNLDPDHTEGFLGIIEDILEDLGDKKFKGTFSFSDNDVEITLDDGTNKQSWKKAVK